MPIYLYHRWGVQSVASVLGASCAVSSFDLVDGVGGREPPSGGAAGVPFPEFSAVSGAAIRRCVPLCAAICRALGLTT